MKRHPRTWAWLSAAALTLSSVSALGQPSGADKQTRDLYRVGKSAFDARRYGDAMRAFDECFRLTKDPIYVWRVGVAAETAYWADQKLDDLKRAVEAFRAYLKDAPDGPKRADATQRLSKLESLLPKTAAPENGDPPAQPPAAPKAARTGVMISSPTPGARIELDHKQNAVGFLVADVAAGPHHVRVEADGYVPVERDVPVQPGALIGVDVPLEPKPASVAIKGPSGARLSINGEPKGELPLLRPLSIAPGEHLITVEMDGARPLVAWRTLERGTSYSVDADLDSTGQRYAAWATFGVAAAAAASGTALTVLALQKQSSAKDLLAPVGDETGSVTPDQLTEFDDAERERDKLRIGAGVAWGITGAALTAGIFLYVFDKPAVQAPPAPRAPKAPANDQPDADAVEIAWAPAVGPSLFGVAVSGRY